MDFTLIFFSAVLLDNIFGELTFITHPVIFIGRLITLLEEKVFTKQNFLHGFFICITTITISGLTAGFFLYVSEFFGLGIILKIYMLYSALAWKDLKDETTPIYDALINNDIVSARKFLSQVVGRDTDNLDKNEISRAAIETIAENSVDGIFSVMFWALLGNFLNHDCGAYISVWIFKASSTLDSMIGYEKYAAFGFTSAKLDDFMNFIPARLGGIIIILSGKILDRKCSLKKSFYIFMRDRKKHKSPNSAHAESAFAAVLNIKLGGGAFYNGIFQEREILGNKDSKEPDESDILRAQKLLDVSSSIFAVCIIIFSNVLLKITF